MTSLRAHHLIDGEFIDAGEELTKHNPSDVRDVVGTVPVADAHLVSAAVAAAFDVRRAWADRGPVARGALVARLAQAIHADRDSLAALISREHGKPERDSRAEVDRTVEILTFAAGMGRRYEGRTLPADTPRTLALSSRHPLGVVALITPWNFPLAIPAWKLAPALVAGCTTVIKPSPLAPFTAQALARLALAVGIPPGVVNVAHGDARTGETLVRDPRVAAVSFTGSVRTGREVAGAAAAHLARAQLELGGKNAVIVARDADLERAAAAVALGAFGQSGQRCSATSRVLAHADVAERLVEMLCERAKALRVGPPTDPASELGPLIDATSLDRCLGAVQRASDGGAEIVVGGARTGPGHGHFMAPTVVRGLEDGAPLTVTEVFGPVVTVQEFEHFDRAMDLNNGVDYGMSATLFTRDLTTMGTFLARAEAGMLHVNRPGVGAFPHMPHLGTKASQLGPAECSTEALDFFTELRTATIDVS